MEGIFRLSGSARRIKELQEIFDSPERYGKGLDWSGYTVHDAANILRRYLNQLPEPIVPLEFYERFREPLRNYDSSKSDGFDHEEAVAKFQQLIRELPPLNKQLLLYILDLLAVFASKSEKNRMTSANLSAIFQPGLLSHPSHDMSPDEYKLSQDVLIFLIENQDHFLFGMNGTAADPKTVEELQNASASSAPANPPPAKTAAPGVRRSASTASAGTGSTRNYDSLRRNVSTSTSRGSSPGHTSGASSSALGTLRRRNTVPSKKSGGLGLSALNRNGEAVTPAKTGRNPPPIDTGTGKPASRSPSHRSRPSPAEETPSNAADANQKAAKKERPHELPSIPAPALVSNSAVSTPTRERKLSSFFARTQPNLETKEGRQPNRLRKKRIPGSVNESAHSSTQSLSGAEATTLPPTSHAPSSVAGQSGEIALHPNLEGQTLPVPSNEGSHHQHQDSESTLRPNGTRTPSMNSRSSCTDHSDPDDGSKAAAAATKKENRRSWLMGRTKRNPDLVQSVSSPPSVAGNNGAEFSTSSVGSSSHPRRSFANDSRDPSSDIASSRDTDVGRSASVPREAMTLPEPEKRGFFDKFKVDKLRARVGHRKEGSTERAKSPSHSDTELSVASTQSLAQVIKEGKRATSMDQPRDSIEPRAISPPAGTQPPPVIPEADEPSTEPAAQETPAQNGVEQPSDAGTVPAPKQTETPAAPVATVSSGQV